MPRGVRLHERRALGQRPGVVLLGIVRQPVRPAAAPLVEDGLHPVALDGHPVAGPGPGVEAHVHGAQLVEVPARLGVLADEERRRLAPRWQRGRDRGKPREAEERAHGGAELDRLDRGGDLAGRDAGTGDEEGDVQLRVGEAPQMADQAVLAERLAVVGGDDDEEVRRVVAAPGELVEQPTEGAVHGRDLAS